MVFANATARTTALSGVLAEGMVSYLKDTDALEIYSGSAWVGYGSGDITGITTGATSGLTGGVTSGTADLKLNTTAKGGLLVGTGSGTVTELTVGSNNTILTADSSTASGLKWATAASGGGMTSIASGSLTGSTVSLTTISGAYKNLQLVVRTLLPATDATDLRLRINGDSTANRHSNQGYASGTNSSFGATSWEIGSGQDNATSNALVVVNLYDYTNTTTWKIGNTISITNNATTSSNFNWNTYFHAYNQTGAITSLDLFMSSGNFTSGTYILYGVS